MAVVFSAIIAGTFIASALSKLRSRSAWSGFVKSIDALELPVLRLASIATGVVASGVVGFELAIAVFVIIPRTSVYGLSLALILLTAFCAVILFAIRNKRTAECRCFGVTGQPLGPVHIARNLLIMSIAACGLFVSGLPIGQLTPMEITVVVLVSLVGVGVIASFDELFGLFSRERR
ncbi:hypothetical protein J7E25_13310 [Agromyces sp. ISL-38]|uniref:MauE/DoxX family redox-associated membrane protein n=1 Tax=Agromyces sp. ISL-38 TaxID=2819107 RepID=UPI001BEBD92C|nr:MauE/DoxX family redox-associated membrane protein [Agromyces sp. ISL-38]MBT2500067.1 hypothetical protein [Agromyces sp. ISL-38]